MNLRIRHLPVKVLIILLWIRVGMPLRAQVTDTVWMEGVEEPMEMAEDILPPMVMGCQMGIEEAKAEVAVGHLGHKSYGYPIDVGHSYEHVSSYQVMAARYKIEFEHMGCEHWPAYDCYNEYMDSVIKARFGPDVYKRAEASADSINKSRMVASGPAYPGDAKALEHHLLQDWRLAKAIGRVEEGEVRVNVLVNESGQIAIDTITFDDWQMRGRIPAAPTQRELTRILTSRTAAMPQWEPARNALGSAIPHPTCFVLTVKGRKLERTSVCFVIQDF
jgi:hypothetical protein